MLKLLKNSYLLFSLLVILILAGISLIISRMTHQAIFQEAYKNLQTESNRIGDALSSIFSEVQTLMVFTGKRISRDNAQDYQLVWKQIHEVLGRRPPYSKSWDLPSFGWLNSENQLVVSSLHGIILNPHDLSMRRYTKEGRQLPWKLHFAPPAYGIPMNRWALTGGIGITDETGKFLGVLALSFDIADLTARIKQVLANTSMEFAVFDLEQNLIITSAADYNFSVFENAFFPFLEKNQQQSFEVVAKNKKDILAMANITPLSDYPFSIITYIENEILEREWMHIMTIHLIEVIGIGIFYLLLLYFLWKRICRKNKELDQTKKNLEDVLLLAKSSDAAKEEFLRCINNEPMVPLNAIVNHVDALLKNLNHKMDTELAWERQVELLEEILNHGLAFKNLTNNILDIKKIDLKKVLEECVIIQSKSAFDKSIKITLEVSDNVSTMHADELKIKQMLVGWLSRAIKYSPPKGTIQIQVTEEAREEKLYIKIIVKDEGFGLSDEMISRLSERLESLHETIDPTEMDFVSIERLVHMHQGFCTMQSQPGRGTTITLFLPAHPLPVERKQLSAFKRRKILPFSTT